MIAELKHVKIAIKSNCQTDIVVVALTNIPKLKKVLKEITREKQTFFSAENFFEDILQDVLGNIVSQKIENKKGVRYGTATLRLYRNGLLVLRSTLVARTDIPRESYEFQIEADRIFKSALKDVLGGVGIEAETVFSFWAFHELNTETKNELKNMFERKYGLKPYDKDFSDDIGLIKHMDILFSSDIFLLLSPLPREITVDPVSDLIWDIIEECSTGRCSSPNGAVECITNGADNYHTAGVVLKSTQGSMTLVEASPIFAIFLGGVFLTVSGTIKIGENLLFGVGSLIMFLSMMGFAYFFLNEIKHKKIYIR